MEVLNRKGKMYANQRETSMKLQKCICFCQIMILSFLKHITKVKFIQPGSIETSTILNFLNKLQNCFHSVRVLVNLGGSVQSLTHEQKQTDAKSCPIQKGADRGI